MNREDKGLRERIKVNIEDYPFTAEEMLLNAEFGKNNKKKGLGNYPFDAEEMLLNAELKEMDKER